MGLTAGREAGRRNMGGFRNFKTSLQVKLFGILFCLISLLFYCSIELHSVSFCQVKVYVLKCEKFGSHFFSCQSLLLGTNVPNDISTI